MKFIQQRIADNGNSTMGFLYEASPEIPNFQSFCLEDEHRDVKVKGETRYPAGLYELKILAEETPLTIKHRKDYGPWFEFHIEITSIPNFSRVYIHAGNDETHTDACLLIGDSLYNIFVKAKNPLSNSIQAVKRFYEYVYPELKKGTRVFLEVRDEKHLLK